MSCVYRVLFCYAFALEMLPLPYRKKNMEKSTVGGDQRDDGKPLNWKANIEKKQDKKKKNKAFAFSNWGSPQRINPQAPHTLFGLRLKAGCPFLTTRGEAKIQTPFRLVILLNSLGHYTLTERGRKRMFGSMKRWKNEKAKGGRQAGKSVGNSDRTDRRKTGWDILKDK